LTADTQCFFSWLVDNLATEVDPVISGRGLILFLGMINGVNTMLLLAGAGGLINGRDTTLLLSASQQFGKSRAMASQRAQAD
jgi:hypothetical protein